MLTMSVKFLKPVRKRSIDLLKTRLLQCECLENALHRPKTCIHHRKRVHKVHFTEEADTFADHSAIGVQCVNDHKINVHLGFLKLRHRYEIRFRTSLKLDSDLQMRQENLNVHAKLLSTHRCSDSEYELKIELFAHKEKLLKETLTLEDASDDSKTLTIILQARVLGQGKGTPSLKTGIRCIGNERDDESEASDWQGFD